MMKIINSLLAGKMFQSRLLNIGNCVSVLCYHRISDMHDLGYSVRSLMNANQAEFEKEIIFLKKHFEVISANQLLDCFNNARSLSRNSLLITFDDGYKDNFTHAYPILRKHNVPAIIFLTTDFIDNDTDLIWTDKIALMVNITHRNCITLTDAISYNLTEKTNKEEVIIGIIEFLKKVDDDKRKGVMDNLSQSLGFEADISTRNNLYLASSEIAEMSASGISFGSHGRSHVILTKIKPEAAKDEIVQSKQKIERIIADRVEWFAYPNGSIYDFNAGIVDVLKSAGYKAAFTTISGLNMQKSDLDRFSLKRISPGNSHVDLVNNLFRLYLGQKFNIK